MVVDRIHQVEAEEDTWLERYARFTCFFGSEMRYRMDVRRTWLKELAVLMRAFTSTNNLYWAFYVRSQIILADISSDGESIIDECLKMLPMELEPSDLAILRGTLLRCKAMMVAWAFETSILSSNASELAPSQQPEELWKKAQTHFKMPGEFLDSDLHYKINLFHWSTTMGQPIEYTLKSYATACTAVHDMNLAQVSIYALIDEWWRSILRDNVGGMINVLAAKMKGKEGYYKFLSQYPPYIAGMVPPYEEYTPEMMERELKSEGCHTYKRKHSEVVNNATNPDESIPDPNKKLKLDPNPTC